MHSTHGLAMRILPVCPTISLSVKRVICDKMEERSSRFLYHTKDHLDVRRAMWQRRWRTVW